MIKKEKKLINMFIVIFLLTVFYNPIDTKPIEKQKTYENIININEKENNQFNAKLLIDKINLEREIFNYNDKRNNVNKNVEILFPSKMPNEQNSVLILAAHSGNSSISYFKNLHKLKIDDTAKIIYNNKEYIYKITNISLQMKTGKINVNISNRKLLILTTCSQKDKTKQIVITSEEIIKNN